MLPNSEEIAKIISDDVTGDEEAAEELPAVINNFPIKNNTKYAAVFFVVINCFTRVCRFVYVLSLHRSLAALKKK